MNSLRLQGIHRLTGGFLVQVNASHNRQVMPKFQAKQNPFFQRRTQLVLACAQRRRKCHHAGTRWDSCGKCSVFELVVDSLFHGSLDVLAQDISFAHKRPLAALYSFAAPGRPATLVERGMSWTRFSNGARSSPSSSAPLT